MKLLSKKKGSVAIFIMLFFVSLLTLIYAYIAAAKGIAVKSAAKELGQVWAESVLGEYNLDLQEKYNIFGFYGSSKELNSKLNYYASESFDTKKYINFSGCSSSLYEYSLANTNMLKKQIVSVGKLDAAGKLADKLDDKLVDSVDETNPDTNSQSAGGQVVIKNKAKLAQLPSAGSSKGITSAAFKKFLSNLDSPSEIIKDGTDLYFENQYIFSYFKNKLDSHNLGKTLFKSEIEYIICGKAKEKSNVSGVKSRIIAAREALNLEFLLTDSTKLAEVNTIAEILTPGPLAAATAKAIQVAWALVESNNDYKLLIANKKVPFIKDENSWAIDLESIFANGFSVEEIQSDASSENSIPEFKQEVILVDPKNEKGQTYEDYLKYMLYLMDENVKLLRVMDLIQINMQYCHDKNFLIRDYNGGLRIDLSVNGRDYEISREYEK